MSCPQLQSIRHTCSATPRISHRAGMIIMICKSTRSLDAASACCLPPECLRFQGGTLHVHDLMTSSHLGILECAA